jgi:hypothetical protein
MFLSPGLSCLNFYREKTKQKNDSFTSDLPECQFCSYQQLFMQFFRVHVESSKQLYYDFHLKKIEAGHGQYIKISHALGLTIKILGIVATLIAVMILILVIRKVL